MPKEAKRDVGDAVVEEIVAAPTAPSFSEEWFAQQFSEHYQNEVRHVPEWGWGHFDGQKWNFDDRELLVGRLLRPFICERVAGRNEIGSATRIAGWRTVSNVEKLLERDWRLNATPVQWDADPTLLNTPNGVINLENGRRREHKPKYYMTKMTSVGAKGECPRWLKFLDEVTGGDQEYVGLLQRIAGYALTGLTVEHALFFAYGLGGNGKSVAIDTLSGILGDYAVTASMETFTQTNHPQHPTELARFRGARLVTASETEEGKRWAEARIKALTGGEPISARFMRQDFFEFYPQFKLLMSGNHKPAIRSVDEGIRRRFHLLPFEVTIPQDKRDLDLTQKLRHEWPGILNWMIDGCLAWQKHGLNPPARIRNATEKYFEAEDAVGRFISECCARTTSDRTPSSELWTAWRDWAEKAGEYQGSQRRFSQSLIERGFEQGRSGAGMYFIGIALKE